MSTRTDQWAEFARSLMRGNSATFQQGYGLGSALIATAEQFSLTTEEMALVADRIAVANFESNGPSAGPEQPQIYVYLTSGGILEHVVTRGKVDVVSVDWDENMERSSEDWREVIAELGRIAMDMLREQEVDDATHELEMTIARERLEAKQATEEETRTKRQRAAALLSDAEIDGILDAHLT